MSGRNQTACQNRELCELAEKCAIQPTVRLSILISSEKNIAVKTLPTKPSVDLKGANA